MADIVRGDPLGPEIEQTLRRTAEKYPSTRSGVIARLRLAEILNERGDTSSAEKEYRGLLKSDALSDTDRELARRGLAGSLALQGKCGDAAPIWKDILARGSLLTPEDIYLSLGDCYETGGSPPRLSRPTKSSSRNIPAAPSSPPCCASA